MVMDSRFQGVPIVVLIDSKTNEARCVNGLHIQTFTDNPLGDREGTLITFASGDTVTVREDFDAVVDAFSNDRQDG